MLDKNEIADLELKETLKSYEGVTITINPNGFTVESENFEVQLEQQIVDNKLIYRSSIQYTPDALLETANASYENIVDLNLTNIKSLIVEDEFRETHVDKHDRLEYHKVLGSCARAFGIFSYVSRKGLVAFSLEQLDLSEWKNNHGN